MRGDLKRNAPVTLEAHDELASWTTFGYVWSTHVSAEDEFVPVRLALAQANEEIVYCPRELVTVMPYNKDVVQVFERLSEPENLEHLARSAGQPKTNEGLAFVVEAVCGCMAVSHCPPICTH